MHLLGKFEKFPEYVHVKFERDESMFSHDAVFKSFSKYTIKHLFT
jgi:hypothetical protein